MSSLIQLSLVGDRRLVILTPQTVRKAFFQFTKVNPEYTGREKYKLDYVSANQWRATILEVLHRKYDDDPYLHPQDILSVERQINKYILDYGLALVEDEGIVREGYLNCHQVGKNRHKVKYIRRYGMFFILDSLRRETIIKMREVDLFIQDSETYDFHLIRYKGIILSSLKSKIRLLFSDRLDFSKTWTQTLEEFKPRQLFLIKEIYPCEGFCLIYAMCN